MRAGWLVAVCVCAGGSALAQDTTPSQVPTAEPPSKTVPQSGVVVPPPTDPAIRRPPPASGTDPAAVVPPRTGQAVPKR